MREMFAPIRIHAFDDLRAMGTITWVVKRYLNGLILRSRMPNLRVESTPDWSRDVATHRIVVDSRGWTGK